ncbi:MAG: hypothetical protein R8N23_17135 [Reichenbachiella sp.]|uniref:hypothetical protein n=1 Tax=Reichenbachiella sp. TaxID=2184521 RepID=UPI0029672224|nr:hypothetical protein [Reichenbachiella sp.]MDW3211599.1 hypothetical protein [Reichenbachiella sp.]
MTGGIGFSRQGKQSFDDNRKLLKATEPYYRSKKDRFFSRRKIKFKVTKEDIHYLIMVKKAKAKQAFRNRVGIFFVLLAVVILIVWVLSW